MNAPLAKEQIALLMSDSLTYRPPVVEGMEGTVAAPRPSFLAHVMDAVRGAIAALAALPRRRAVLVELSNLTDRELADIGLTRGELARVFETGAAQNRRG